MSSEYGMAPRLLDKPGQTFHEYKNPSRPPVPAFHSEYIGRTVEELVVIFNQMVGDKEGLTHANCNFIVLDEQTLVDATVLGVSVLGGLRTLRADFTMAIEILGAAEINLETLDEGAYSEFYERGEPVTVEGWKAQQARWEERDRERKEQKK
ncbi:hypothetical protein MMC30_007748 [Trapelia coarctata]|nr:hypothetical protein [Trapelia coarctata]